MCYGRPCTSPYRPMLRKLTVSYGPTEMLYNIGASPGGLPAGEASPSRHADCGTGTTGARRMLRKLTVSYGPTEMLNIYRGLPRWLAGG